MTADDKKVLAEALADAVRYGETEADSVHAVGVLRDQVIREFAKIRLWTTISILARS